MRVSLWVCLSLPCPWSTFVHGSCGRCGCTLGAASTPLRPPVLAPLHPPWWWSSHDGTARRNMHTFISLYIDTSIHALGFYQYLWNPLVHWRMIYKNTVYWQGYCPQVYTYSTQDLTKSTKIEAHEYQWNHTAISLCTVIYSIYSMLDLLYCFLWPTCAILWCWMSITRDMAIWTLPNTATTSRILSSKLGAWNVCRKKPNNSYRSTFQGTKTVHLYITVNFSEHLKTSF